MNERQEKIVDIISKSIIGTQAELQAALEREGVRAAQATISRDIKALKLVRELTPQGKYRYVRPRERTVDAEQRLRAIFRGAEHSGDKDAPQPCAGGLRGAGQDEGAGARWHHRRRRHGVSRHAGRRRGGTTRSEDRKGDLTPLEAPRARGGWAML